LLHGQVEVEVDGFDVVSL